MLSRLSTRFPWLTWGFGFLAGILAAMLGETCLRHRTPPPPVPPAATQPAGHAAEAVKPWGHLEALKIPLGNSEEIFADRPVRLQATHWFFEGFSSNQLAGLFGGCGLEARQRAELLNPSRWQIASNGCLVLPDNALVRSLSAGSRQQLYAVLARSSSNYAQCYPFRLALENLDAHFAESGLSVDTQHLLRGLCYTNCGTLCLADLQCLPELLPKEEFQEVIDFLYRFPAYRLRLRVYPDSDIEGLVKYWGKGGREKKIRPLLESLTKVPATNGASISIGYLLPPFARLRLNTFPEAWTEPQAPREDCFWTSMNFFNEPPDMRFLDAGQVRQALQTEYVPVQQPTYGDLVTVVSERGDGLHMCVYIADNFVFTKNGMNPLQPWVLMKLPDMLLSFPAEQGPRLVIFRRKPGSA